MHHDLTYFLGTVPHVAGIVFALVVFARHEDKFQKSSFKHIFSSRTEQHCPLLCVSIIVNSLAVYQIIPRWMADRPVISNDFWYIIYHISVGAFVVVSHIMTMQELNKMGTKQQQGELVT